MSALFALAVAALPACVAATPANADGQAPVCTGSPDWRTVATRADGLRLRDWRDAFVKALDEARAGGHGDTIAAQGALLQPDAGQDDSALPDGRYTCRTIKLGTAGGNTTGHVAYPPVVCEVRTANGVTTLEKRSGPQRSFGRIYPGGVRQQIFLGSLVLGDENRALAYGRDPQRDIAGRVERLAPNRWRIVMPYPRFESTLDVMELVPAS